MCDNLSKARNEQVPSRGRQSRVDRQALRTLVAENYPVISRNLLRPLLHLFSTSREACSGDIEKFLIMLVVAIRTTEHECFATYTPAQLISGELPVFPTLGTNVRSVAESTGTPRETVRRKVGELVETGWISRQANELRFTARAYQDLAQVRLAIEELAVINYEVVSDLTKRHLAAISVVSPPGPP